MIDTSLLAPERVRPLRRAEYDRLVELGCFEDERVELIEGVLVEMSPQGTGHAHVIRKLNMLLAAAVAGRAVVQPQLPFGASEYSEPEPDLALLPDEDYSHAHPTRAFLVIEVAASSLRKDRLVKAALYARAGVPEYWIVDVAGDAVEVHRAPRGGAYTAVSVYGRGEVLRPEAFDDVRVPIAEILPTPG